MVKNIGYFSLSVLIGCTMVGISSAYPAVIIEIADSESYSGMVISQSSTIINNGTITGTINVDNGNNLYIQNRGTFNATVSLGVNSTVTQIISQQIDITTLNGISTNYDVRVQNTTDILGWSTIIEHTVGATGFTLDNAEIRLSNLDTIDADIEIIGNVFVHINEAPLSDVLLFSDISGTGLINVVVDNLDPLYSSQTS